MGGGVGSLGWRWGRRTPSASHPPCAPCPSTAQLLLGWEPLAAGEQLAPRWGWVGRKEGKTDGGGEAPEPSSTAGPILNPPAGQPCPALPWSGGRAFGMKLLIS